MSAPLPPEDPFGGGGLVPDAFASAVLTWHALQQLRPAEAARAVAALDTAELRRLVFVSLACRASGFYLSIAEGGGLVMRNDDLDADPAARDKVRRGLGRFLNAITEAEPPGEEAR